ncbi:MAG: copper homeostasis protein CutC [Bacteroidota bacterium]
MVLEICANSYSSALRAQQAGAHRIELCSNLPVGGTTPSAATIRLCRRQLQIPIHVLIRPRPGDFCYDAEDVELIGEDILFCKSEGLDGVVIGGLQPDGQIDLQATRRWIDLARPLSVTFHRAFDKTPDPLRALDQLIELGVDRLLSSGQRPTAYEGRQLLGKMVERAAGRLEILAGAGLNANNVAALVQASGVREVHLSARSRCVSRMQYRGNKVRFGGGAVPEEDYYRTDPEVVRQVLAVLETL